MHFQLRCDRCGCSFSCPENTPAGGVLVRLQAEGPGSILGDGETVEDRLFADLSAHDDLACSQCGTSVAWSEARLGQLSLQLLQQW